MIYNNLFDIEIGKNCDISKESRIDFNDYDTGKIRIGDNVKIGRGVLLRTFQGNITIEDNVSLEMDVIIEAGGNVQIKQNTLISPRVQIYAQNCGMYREALIRDQDITTYGIWIDEDCWIGAGSIILDGCRIEKGVVVGAGSVVNENLDIGCGVYAGNPAKYKKMRPNYSPLAFACKDIQFPDIATTLGENKTPVKFPENPPTPNYERE